MSKKQLSATMAIALAETIDRGGKLVRHQGGYWTEPGAVKSASGARPFAWYIPTVTIQALVRRDELRYTEHRTGRAGEFPIAAEVLA